MSRLTLLRCKSLISGVCTSRSTALKALQNRNYCQNANALKPKVTESSSGQHLFRNERKPTGFDKKVLVWAGRFKKEEDIPEYVSCEVVAAARNNVRIKTCIVMMVCTILGCVAMVISGKKALREDNTLLKRNIERKAKWREEAAQEQMPSIKNH